MPAAHGRAPIDADRLQTLVDRTWWGPVQVCAEVGSTNVELADRARTGAEPQVLVAEHQPAGRGRLGRSWQAPPRSGLAVSVLMRPPVPIRRWSWLPLVAGLTVAEVVRGSGLPAGVRVGLKWPNDVQVNGAKVAGVLAERVDDSQLVLGVGLNVTLTQAELPTTGATSLLLADAAELDRTVLLARYLQTLHEDCARWWAAADDAAVRARYRQACTTLGQEVAVELPGGRIERGVAGDIDASGALVVDAGEGSLVVAAGDVTHVRAG